RRLCPPRAAHVAAAHALWRPAERVLLRALLEAPRIPGEHWLRGGAGHPRCQADRQAGVVVCREHEPFTPGAEARLFSGTYGTTEVLPFPKTRRERIFPAV